MASQFPIEEYLRARQVQDQPQQNPLAGLAAAFTGGVGQGMVKRQEANLKQNEEKQQLVNKLIESHSKGNTFKKKSNPQEIANPADVANYLRGNTDVDVIEVPKTKTIQFYDLSQQQEGSSITTSEDIELKPMQKLTKTEEQITKEVQAREEGKKGIVPVSEAGRMTLAQESIKGIDEVIKMLFPSGDPKDYNRVLAGKSNIPVFGSMPNDKEAQKVYNRMSTALSGRQLIQTGVAARPDETKQLYKAFVGQWFSNPEATYDQLNRLKDFYNNYSSMVTERGLSKNQNINVPQKNVQSIETPQQKTGGQIMIDANGNKAMVYPDGSYEEINNGI